MKEKKKHTYIYLLLILAFIFVCARGIYLRPYPFQFDCVNVIRVVNVSICKEKVTKNSFEMSVWMDEI